MTDISAEIENQRKDFNLIIQFTNCKHCSKVAIGKEKEKCNSYEWFTRKARTCLKLEWHKSYITRKENPVEVGTNGVTWTTWKNPVHWSFQLNSDHHLVYGLKPCKAVAIKFPLKWEHLLLNNECSAEIQPICESICIHFMWKNLSQFKAIVFYIQHIKRFIIEW